MKSLNDLRVFPVFTFIAMMWIENISAQEPVIGGPCEGCEFVFVGMPDEPEFHSRIAPTTEAGDQLVIEGVVRTSTGQPASNIIVYAYHTDKTGVYPKGSTWHGRLRGWARTNLDGRYRFHTIRPGAYPARNIPQHVHMHIIEPKKGTYYINDIVFGDDPLLTVDYRERAHHGRGGSGLVQPKKDKKGIWTVQRDILLGKNIPAYKIKVR